MKKARINEIWGVLFLLLGLFTLASLLFFHPEDLSFYTSHPSKPVQNVTGIIGAYTAFGLTLTFGLSAFMIPALFLLWSGCFFLQKVPEKKFFKFLGLAIALFSTSTLVTISVPAGARFEQGGAIGYLAGSHLLRYFGHVGSFILAGSCLLLSLLLATDFLLYPIFRKLMLMLHERTAEHAERLQDLYEWIKLTFVKSPDQKQRVQRERASELPDTPIKVKRYQPGFTEAGEKPVPQETEPAAAAEAKLRRVKEVKRPAAKANEEETGYESVIGSAAPKEGQYGLPSVELLKVPAQSHAGLSENLQENSKILESTLAEFGIEVKVVEVEQGPVITRYELLPAPGVKVNSIAALSDDIALALKAISVRLIIPIPGKSAVGVEVPNSVSSMVCLREMIETQSFRSRKMVLPLALGKDTSGKPLIADLTTMPHILIAGTTGSGKTVCVNSIVMGLLYHCTPSDLKMIMVDPKMVELTGYNKLPHMLSPVVTDVRKASHTLNWVVNEMENRYKLFATVGVRNIQGFNARPMSELAKEEVEGVESENVVPARLPYIVVIIDELADLMMVAQDKVETAITRLAQLSRAVGIHLILATQRPSVDVITGVIKANFPARISFKVASKVDSRTVLDGIGADRLIGKGDMLFMQPGDAKPTRGQGAFVTDEEINRVVAFCSNQAKPEYHEEITQAQDGKTGGGAIEKDELFDEAVSIVLQTGQASTSNLQRRLRLGYTRAARIIDQMEAEGMVGPAHGAKPREIYISTRTEEEPATP